jgi:RsiW-degrading membrane proteinase PrsW (M82 family)
MDFHNMIPFIYALLGGILPAFIWLFFWMKEDKKNPEPKYMIILAFIGGIIAVFLSLYFEKIIFNIDPNKIFFTDFLQKVLSWFKDSAIQQNIPLNKILLVALFAPFIEELSKFILAYILVLRSKSDDEPIDPMIYMVTVAIGFAALENTLFLIDPMMKNQITTVILTGNIRFIGATLLHTVSSVTVGIFISFNFFDSKLKKFIWTILGLICAIFIHSLFNFFMAGSSQNSFLALEGIWILVIIVMLIFEKIKKFKKIYCQKKF